MGEKTYDDDDATAVLEIQKRRAVRLQSTKTAFISAKPKLTAPYVSGDTSHSGTIFQDLGLPVLIMELFQTDEKRQAKKFLALPHCNNIYIDKIQNRLKNEPLYSTLFTKRSHQMSEDRGSVREKRRMDYSGLVSKSVIYRKTVVRGLRT